MIVTPQDVAALRETLRKHAVSTKWVVQLHRAQRTMGPDASADEVVAETFKDLSPEEWEAFENPERATHESFLLYLRDNLHFLIPCGFDEVRIDSLELENWRGVLNKPFFERFPDAPDPHFFERPDGAPLALQFGLRCRDLRSGAWYGNFHFDEQAQTVNLKSPSGETRCIAIQDIPEHCERSLSAPGNPAVMLLPNLWKPPETHPTIELVDATRALLLALQNEGAGFSRLTWQQLEDVVAELLRARGLQIQATPRSRDGGRDILARGELIPGEPAVLAVEVKHRDVVCIDEVRSRLYANREFPALLFATSGRFSAGVVREKTMPENFLRLMLKDGQALSDWVRAYKPR